MLVRLLGEFGNGLLSCYPNGDGFHSLLGKGRMQRLAVISTPTQGWQARLALGFQRQGSRTILSSCAHRGPLQVQRPFYPEGEAVCHVAILHPPGGVVGGDDLQLDAAFAAGTHGFVTTPAAGKFYRSAGPTACQTQRLTVAPGATLEWLPQESIVYAGAQVHAATHIMLHGDARFIGWEVLCLGRPAAGEDFTTGDIRQDVELWRDGEPVYLEHGRYSGDAPLRTARWGLQGRPVSAALWCSPAVPEAVPTIRAEWLKLTATLPPIPEQEWATVTAMDGVLIGRYLGPSTARARRFLIRAWNLLRPMLLNRPSCPSRFWNT